jgi:hypothetical protein
VEANPHREHRQHELNPILSAHFALFLACFFRAAAALARISSSRSVHLMHSHCGPNEQVSSSAGISVSSIVAELESSSIIVSVEWVANAKGQIFGPDSLHLFDELNAEQSDDHAWIVSIQRASALKPQISGPFWDLHEPVPFGFFFFPHLA